MNNVRALVEKFGLDPCSKRICIKQTVPAGPHFCLGAFLARMEIRVLLEEMFRRELRLVRTADPIRTASNFVHGVLSVDMMPVKLA